MIINCELQQCCATLVAVTPCCIEVTSVPRVGNGFSFASLYIVEQQMYLALRVSAAHSLHIAYVILVHTYEEVIMLIVRRGELSCSMSLTLYAVLSQLPASGRIDGVAQFLGGGCGGGYLILCCEMRLIHHVLHYVFCHRTSADIAVADEKYFFHETMNCEL